MPTSDVVTLTEEDLDEEDLEILKEVSKKGYYHGRPKSESTAAPQRIETPQRIDAGAASSVCSRRDVDEYQKKWDQFDSDKLIRKLERKAGRA